MRKGSVSDSCSILGLCAPCCTDTHPMSRHACTLVGVVLVGVSCSSFLHTTVKLRSGTPVMESRSLYFNSCLNTQSCSRTIPKDTRTRVGLLFDTHFSSLLCILTLFRKYLQQSESSALPYVFLSGYWWPAHRTHISSLLLFSLQPKTLPNLPIILKPTVHSA